MSAELDPVAHLEDAVREATRTTARSLRRLADDLDRVADQTPVDRIPQEVANKIAWGVANARVDGPAMWLHELATMREVVARSQGVGDVDA